MNGVQPIDAVYTWVDGGDPAHIEKINTALVALGFRPRSAASTRFASRGEIFQSLRSLDKFAPFFRHIHIVTDNQRPDFENQPGLSQVLLDKIRIVDHKDIFRDHLHALPTFNSRSIEALLYRIPGLAEQYVYFNDDMSLIKPIGPEHFFGPNGPVLRGYYDVMPHYRIKRRLQKYLTDTFGFQFDTYQYYSYKLSQAKAAEHAGFRKKFYLLGHDPHALRQSTFQRFFDEHPEILDINIRDKFRTDSQFNVAALAYHLEIRAGTGHPHPKRNLLYIKPNNQFRLALMLKDAERNPEKLFCCVQSLDLYTPANQQRIIDWLANNLEHTHADFGTS
jgi:hypothetical protein